MKQVIEKIEAELTNNYESYYRLAYSYVRNEQDALDIVQESAYKAIKCCNKLKSDEFISTWIYRIVVNEALNIIRKNKKTISMEPDWDEGREDRYEDVDLKDAIRNLGEPEHTIVKLRFFEELSIKDISQILDLNENTTKSRLYRALEKLKRHMEEKEYESVIKGC